MARLLTTPETRVKTVQQRAQALGACVPHAQQAQNQTRRHSPPCASLVVQMRLVAMGRALSVARVPRLAIIYLAQAVTRVPCEVTPKPPGSVLPAQPGRSPTVRRASASIVPLARQVTAPVPIAHPAARAHRRTPRHASRALETHTRPTELHAYSVPQVRSLLMITSAVWTLLRP